MYGTTGLALARLGVGNNIQQFIIISLYFRCILFKGKMFLGKILINSC